MTAIDLATDWTLIDFDSPKKTASSPANPLPKGVCPKCGKVIGRGLHFHVKACDGHLGKAR